MTRLLGRLSPWLLLTLCLTPLFCSGPAVLLANDDDIEDAVDGEDEDGVVNDEEDVETVTMPDTAGSTEEDNKHVIEGKNEEEEEEEEEDSIKASPNAETTILFTSRQEDNFVAGETVQALIGLLNKGNDYFVVSGIEASFRYPQDFNYFIQNFSMVYYDTYIPPNTQGSFVYSFKPSESFYARPFGLVVNVYYRDLNGSEFRDAVFNNTVNIVEIQEGFDAETFFIYVFMVSGLCLLMFIIHYVWSTTKRSGRSVLKKKPVETGTQNKHNDIDYDWLPDNLNPNKSPRASPRAGNSPRNRRKKQTGSTNVD